MYSPSTKKQFFQTPQNDLITGFDYLDAIKRHRKENGHEDKYYDRCYNWKLHSDTLHLIQIREENV